MKRVIGIRFLGPVLIGLLGLGVSGILRALNADYNRPGPLMDYAPQEIGIYDTTYESLTEDDCRACHGGALAERHHYGQRNHCSDCYPAGESGCLYCHPVESPPGYFPKGDPDEYIGGIRRATDCKAEQCQGK